MPLYKVLNYFQIVLQSGIKENMQVFQYPDTYIL